VSNSSFMRCCANPMVKDLSQGLGAERHYYCQRCKAHVWRGVKYTAKEWHNWINATGDNYDEVER